MVCQYGGFYDGGSFATHYNGRKGREDILHWEVGSGREDISCETEGRIKEGRYIVTGGREPRRGKLCEMRKLSWELRERARADRHKHKLPPPRRCCRCRCRQLILTTGELCNNSISIFLQCFFRGILCNTNLRCNISTFFNTFQEDFDQMLNFSSRCNTRCSTLQHIQVDATLH